MPNRNFVHSIVALLAVWLLVQPEVGFCTNYFGRIITGAYFSNESGSDPADGTQSNNGAVISNRFYFNATDFSRAKLEMNVDLRDKYDFFDKLDQANLALDPVNKFQAYQLNIKLPEDQNCFYGTLGRFNLSEAGGTFTDGMEAGHVWNREWRSSVFGGLDPRRPDQTYVGYNSDSQIFGTYTTFQPRLSATQNTYYSTALVGETVQGHLDRFYWYDNVIYSWSEPNQIVAVLYLDFVPHPYVQTGLLSYHQEINKDWSTSTSVTAVDVIEYQRQQNVLQTLPSSPYREGSINLRRNLATPGFYDLTLTYGVRQMDGLQKAEVSTGPSFYRLLDEHLSTSALVGARRSFGSNEGFARVGANYFLKNWEFDLSLNYVLSVTPDVVTYHEWLNEFSLARYFSRDFFGNVSIQQGQDERVSIWSGLVKISYLFGDKKTAPIPDQAPPPKPAVPAGRVY